MIALSLRKGGYWASSSLLLTLLAWTPAAIACNLNIVNVTSGQWTGRGRGYEVYDSARQAQVVNFTVESRNGSCSYFVTVSPVSAPSGGSGTLRGSGSTLRYDIYKDGSASQPLKPANLAGSSEVYSAVAPSGTSQAPLQFAFIVWPGQVVSGGLYSDEVEIAAYEGQLGNGILRDRRRMSIAAQVPQVAEISFSGGGGFDPNYNTYTVNFSAMRAGDRRLVNLKARSNGGYRILLSSPGGGVLHHVDPMDTSTVPYTLSVDGAQISLAGGGSVPAILNSALTPATGQDHRLEFNVGDTTNASAGDYRDVINISVFSLR